MCKVSWLQNEGRCTGGFCGTCLLTDEACAAKSDHDGKADK